MGKSTTDNGKTEKCMEKESSSNKTALHTQVNGSTTYNTVTVTKNGQTELNTKAISLKEKSKVTAS